MGVINRGANGYFRKAFNLSPCIACMCGRCIAQHIRPYQFIYSMAQMGGYCKLSLNSQHVSDDIYVQINNKTDATMGLLQWIGYILDYIAQISKWSHARVSTEIQQLVSSRCL